jgi:hypothetical protein
MSVTFSPFLRNALYADALVSGAAAILMVSGASLLSPLLGLPSPLMAWAGIALVPFVVMLVVVARRDAAPRAVLLEIIAINALWVVASFGLLASSLVSPNWLGVAFVAAQAVTVALFAELQFVGLKRSEAAA